MVKLYFKKNELNKFIMEVSIDAKVEEAVDICCESTYIYPNNQLTNYNSQ